MTTALQLMKRSMRLIGAMDSEEPLSAEQARDLLDILNSLLAELHEAEVGVPDYTVASNTTTLRFDAADREAIAYELAIRIAPEYGFAVSGDIYSKAAELMQRMRLRYFQPGDSDFSELPNDNQDFDITRG